MARFRLCGGHSKQRELFCLDCKQLLCVKCLLEEGHRVHDICDIGTAFAALRGDFAETLVEARRTEAGLQAELAQLEGGLAREQTRQGRLKQALQSAYQALKQKLKARKARLLRRGQARLDRKLERIRQVSRTLALFEAEKKKWQAPFEVKRALEDETRFSLLGNWARTAEDFAGRIAGARRPAQRSEEAPPWELGVPADSTEAELRLLEAVRSSLEAKASAGRAGQKGQLRKAPPLRKKSAQGPARGKGESRGGPAEQNYGRISKNLKSLQKDLSQGHRTQFRAIESRLTRICAGFQKAKCAWPRRERDPFAPKKSLRRGDAGAADFPAKGAPRPVARRPKLKMSFPGTRALLFASPSQKAPPRLGAPQKFHSSERNFLLEAEALRLFPSAKAQAGPPAEAGLGGPVKENVSPNALGGAEHSFRTDFALSIHDNEEISLASIQKQA